MWPPRAERRARAAALLAAALLTAAAALATEPEDYQVIKRLVGEGASATAAERAQAYLEQYPQGANRDQVAAWLGALLAARGEAEAALALLEGPLPGLPPKSRGPVNLARARAYLDLRRPAKAKPLLEAPGPLDKADMADFHRLQARAAYDLDQPAEAVRALRALPPGERTAADDLLLARALVLSGEDAAARDAAAALLERGALATAETAELRLLLAGALYRLEDFDGALAAAAPLRADPARSGEALLLEAWALHRKGDDARAYDLARKAAPLTGWEDGALLAPLRVAALADDTAALGAAARKLLGERPGSPAAAEAHLALARVLEERGDPPAALRELEAALPALPAGPAKHGAALAAGRLAAGALRDWPRARRHFALALEVGPSEPDRADALLASAHAAWALGAAGDALSAVARLVRDYPSTPSVPAAYLLLGDLRCAEGELAQGREAYGVVLDSFPDAPQYPAAALALAESLRARGEPAASQPLALLAGLPLEPALARRRDRLAAALALEAGDPASAQAALLQAPVVSADRAEVERDRFTLGLARLAAGDLEGARESFEALSDPQLVRAGRLRTAQALFASGDPAQGAELLESLAAAGGRDGRTALWILADRWAAQGDAPKASAALDRLAASAGDDPLAALAQRKIEVALLAEQGPSAALVAVAAFREAEPRSPGRAADLLRAARLRQRAGDREEATRLYGAYLERLPQGPGAAEAALEIAREAARRGDWKGVRTTLEAAPAGVDRDLLLGEACFALRDMAAAQEAYERALASKPAPPATEASEARYRAGMAASIQGRVPQAVAHWTAFAQTASTGPAGRERLFQVALWLQRQGALEAALAALGRLREAWRDAAVGFQHGYTLELLGRPGDALAAYLKVAYVSSNAQWALTARYRAAELMLELGRREDALALYRELAERTEGSVQGDYARRRLEALAAAPAPTPAVAPDAPSPPATPPKEEAPDAPAAPAR